MENSNKIQETINKTAPIGFIIPRKLRDKSIML